MKTYHITMTHDVDLDAEEPGLNPGVGAEVGDAMYRALVDGLRSAGATKVHRGHTTGELTEYGEEPNDDGQARDGTPVVAVEHGVGKAPPGAPTGDQADITFYIGYVRALGTAPYLKARDADGRSWLVAELTGRGLRRVAGIEREGWPLDRWGRFAELDDFAEFESAPPRGQGGH
jgi:hypothetical protein